MPRLQVILSDGEQKRLDAYCKTAGFKKSTLAARLIRDHLDKAGFDSQPSLLVEHDDAEQPGNRLEKASRKS